MYAAWTTADICPEKATNDCLEKKLGVFATLVGANISNRNSSANQYKQNIKYKRYPRFPVPQITIQELPIQSGFSKVMLDTLITVF